LTLKGLSNLIGNRRLTIAMSIGAQNKFSEKDLFIENAFVVPIFQNPIPAMKFIINFNGIEK
jgi:hypothetical protein